MNQQPVVQEATESAGHVVLGKMKTERQYGYCLQTHQQVNTKGIKKELLKLLVMEAQEKKSIQNRQQKP